MKILCSAADMENTEGQQAIITRKPEDSGNNFIEQFQFGCHHREVDALHSPSFGSRHTKRRLGQTIHHTHRQGLHDYWDRDADADEHAAPTGVERKATLLHSGRSAASPLGNLGDQREDHRDQPQRTAQVHRQNAQPCR